MGEIEFLARLKTNTVHWGHGSVEMARSLQERGLAEYVTDIHSGQWIITQKGKDYLKKRSGL